MPDLVLKGSGRAVFVPPDALADALASGMYEAPDDSAPITVEMRPGLVGRTTVGSLSALQAGGAVPETEDTFHVRERSARIDREHGGIGGTILTAIEGAANEATLGATGAIGELVGGDDYTERRLERAEANPIASGLGRGAGIVGPALLSGGAGAAGSIARATPAGAAAALGARVGRAAEGASAAAKVARGALGGALEGSIIGAGQGVQQLTDSTDPLTIERAASVLSSNALFGAATGGVAGAAAKGVELGLSKASRALKDRAAAVAATKEAPEIAEDLATLDAKGLRAAQKLELEALEAARVPQRQAIADDLAAFRGELKESKLWLATKGAEARELREIGKLSLEADKAVDRVLRNPKMLATNPKAALAGLQQQEHALELLAKQSDNLRVKFAGDASGDRLAALGAVPGALERNRAMQARIGELAAAPSSARLLAIDDAKDALAMGGARSRGMPEQLLQGSVFSAATGAASFLGPLAPLVGAKAARFVAEKVFGGLGKATTAAAAKSAEVAAAFLDVTARATRSAPPLATRVLSAVSYGPTEPAPRAPKGKGDAPTKAATETLMADAYRARSSELRSQTMYAPNGSTVLRPEARAAMADRLAPIRAADPQLADRIETHAAARLEYVASKLPRRPDMGVMQVGPDRWQPSDMEMRTFARIVAATEDPAGVEARLVDGSITPEDADAYRTLYPERFADLRNRIIGEIANLRATLPYERRLSLSIFTGIPVDPSMHPDVLAVLQSSFAAEENSAGGTQAPTPQPQFGSVRAEPATPAQQREQGA